MRKKTNAQDCMKVMMKIIIKIICAIFNNQSINVIIKSINPNQWNQINTNKMDGLKSME